MAKIFGATSTTEDVLSGVNLKAADSCYGSFCWAGVETARALAAHGAQVVGRLEI